jgi:universal stress protein E
MFRHLAVGVDLGPDRRQPTGGSRAALEQARVLARRWSARLTLLHSSRADEHWDAERGWVFVDGDAPDSGSVLEELAAELVAKGLRAEVHVAHDSPDLALAQLALGGGVDLVLVGKRSVPGLDGRQLGCVALKALRSCPCAVWIVDSDAPPTPGRVLAATDLTPAGERVLELAARVAGDFSAELHVVHALQIPLSAQLEDVEEWAVTARREAEARIARCLESTPAAGKAALHVAPSSPTRAILECAARLTPDLTVLGSVSRGGVAGLVVGNTAERVLPRLDGSLLVIKPPDFVSLVR